MSADCVLLAANGVLNRKFTSLVDDGREVRDRAGGHSARKMDAEGQGRVAYLSRETVGWLKIWMDQAKNSEGAVFRRLIGRKEIAGPLNPGSIAPIFSE
jgi:hypothetical protein